MNPLHRTMVLIYLPEMMCEQIVSVGVGNAQITPDCINFGGKKSEP